MAGSIRDIRIGRAQMTLPAKKSLGQHFLHHPATLEKIVSLAKVSGDDLVLEIGPGPGGLTNRLVEKAKHLVAIEKDSRFVDELRERYKGLESVEIIEEDVLKVDFSKLLIAPRYKVVANLPYNIATEIIFRLLDHRDKIQDMYLMVQKEVADRIVATPAQRKDYSVLSLTSQIYSENKIVMKLPPGAFFPAPKVDSAIVHFKVSPEPRYPLQNFPFFKKLVQTVFSQRRKKMINPLRSLLKGKTAEEIISVFNQIGISADVRPEEVSLESFAA
ncbi:MAG: ribosomal RNA small subunit methyltransferase A [Deltaproteobacteria bacterium]|nr:MAG: ribosomal RNA small subunit methyltransferase A [Deltaproteobacteria bacterium]